MSFKLFSGSVILVVLISVASSSGAVVTKCSECPKEFAPVCGSDGITWPNKCILECHIPILNKDIKVVSEGPCATTTTTQESTKAKSTNVEDNAMNAKITKGVDKTCVCVRNFAPICGTDGVTYANICELRCARQKNANLEVFGQGSCDKNKRNKRALYERRYSLHKSMPCSS